MDCRSIAYVLLGTALVWISLEIRAQNIQLQDMAQSTLLQTAKPISAKKIANAGKMPAELNEFLSRKR